MAATPHIPKVMRSLAFLDTADKGNYLAKANYNTVQLSPITLIKNVHSPSTLLPWGKRGKKVSA